MKLRILYKEFQGFRGAIIFLSSLKSIYAIKNINSKKENVGRMLA